jgi:radical SAM protein with 4Fe4S-binding SPASM domain
MFAAEGIPVRYNEEYFGYIAGYPDGDIVLTQPSAGPLLAQGVPRQALEPHLLTTLDVREPFHLQTPPLVWLELTRRCNLTCPHCYIEGGEARANEMPASEFYRLLDEFAEMGVWGVALTGGEPTLHPEFGNLVRHARQNRLLVGIATNGMFLTSALLDSLPRDGVIISVSLDNLHIDGRHDFDVATKAILRSQASGFLTNIMTNSNSQNTRELRSLMAWAEGHGVSVRSVPFSPLGRGKRFRHLENTTDDVAIAAEFWLRECEWEHEYHRRAGLCVGSIFNYGLSLGFMTGRCSSGRFNCYVCADGTVYPCTMCAGEEILSPGNVHGRSFIDLWRGDWPIRHYSWKNFKDTCNGCIVNDPRYYCSSRCPAMSHARNGHLFGCGSSSFEKLSLITRTAMLERTTVGQTTGVPVEQSQHEQSQHEQSRHEPATPRAAERERTIIPLQFVG